MDMRVLLPRPGGSFAKFLGLMQVQAEILKRKHWQSDFWVSSKQRQARELGALRD